MKPWHVPIVGPLAPLAPGFREYLARQGYKTWPASRQIWLLGRLSRWLGIHNLQAEDLTTLRIDQFLRASHEEGHRRPRSARGMSPLLNHLRSLGLAPAPVRAMPVTPADVIIQQYQTYLVQERGLATSTVRSYLDAARLFLSQQGQAGGEFDLQSLTTATVGSFVVSHAGRRSVYYTASMATGLRSLLRFLHLTGYIDRPLADAVPSVARWQLASLPRGISSKAAAQLLRSCDRRTTLGRRDFAILTILLRLGLRASEVAALRLYDIDWRAGELTVGGKGNREDRLPLPVDVGEAVVAWLQRGRQQVTHPFLFTRVPAPHDGLSSSGVSQVVSSACRRVGIPRVGAHRLRHTAATEMLRAGGSLAEVAQVLRHQSVATTSIYAKVDRSALSAVVRPWPGPGAA